MKNQIFVFCVGPARSVRGGITRMIEKISSVFPDHVRFRTIASFSQYSGSDHPDPKSRLVQIVVYLFALVRVIFAGVFFHDAIFHVQLSVKGSTLRKGVICTVLRVLRCRYVVHAHAAEDAIFHAWVPKPVRRLLLWGLAGADSFIALTRFWGDYYATALGIPGDRVLLLPNPAVIPPVLPDRPEREALHFLFAGRIGKRKGAFELIQAFATLPPEIRNRSRITLAGDGEVDAARELAGRLGCSAQVSVPGWVGPDESERLLADADAFLLPSYAEGMSMALLEAMAWGLPVVTTASGGADEFLRSGSNCLLIEPGGIQELADAMCTLAQDPQLRARLGAEARKTAAGFRVELYVEKLTGLYEELVKPGRGNVRMQPELPAKRDLPSSPAPALEDKPKATVMVSTPRTWDGAKRDQAPVLPGGQAYFRILGLPVAAMQIPDVIEQMEEWIARHERCHSIAFTGLHGVSESNKHPEFKHFLKSADLVVADGMPLVWLGRLRGHALPRRVYGPELLETFCRETGAQFRHFFYGGAPGVADGLAQSLQERFQIIVAGTYSPPFRELTEEEDQAIVDLVHQAAPNVLWVGLSTPKQERWMHEHRARLGVPVLLGVGAAFDICSGQLRQAPVWMRENGLEWLFRLSVEPRRLWKRYLVTIPSVLWKISFEIVGLKRLD